MNYRNYKLSKIRAIAIFLVILIPVFTGCAQNMAAKKDMEVSPEPKLITEISTSENPESFNILVKGNRLLTYMSVKQLFPLAVLLYFPETALLDNIKTNILPESEIVGPITASELNEKGHKSRIEILLKKDVPYKAANEETGLKISFSRPSKALSSPILSSSTLSSSGPVEKKEEKAVVESKTTIEYKKPAWVNRIDFSSEEAGKSTIIIGTTRPVEYKIKKASPQLLQLKLIDTRLPDYRKFPIITTRFESAVDRIIPVQTPAMKNTSMLTIELRETVPYFIEQNGDLLLVHFEASSIAPRPLEDAKLPAWKKVLTQTVTKEEIDIDKKTPEGLVAEKYTGEKIALDFYETDIKNVFRILQEVSGKNFAIDKDVAGKVTLTLDKPVPWDQVLDLVLKMNQLGRVFEGDVIRIATAETLKKEAVFKRDKLALEPLVTEYISVNYANAQEDLLPKIEAILTERGNAGADQRTNTIIITAIPDKINMAREIVKNLDKVTPQVIIEARIVEATTSFSREIGTQWGAAGGIQEDDPRAGIGPQRGYDVLGGTYGYNMAMNVPSTLLTTSMGGIGFNFTKIAGTPFLLNAMLLAMESEGEGKIISSPKIVTLDNKEATITQGLRYPYLKLDESGNTTTVFEDIDLVLKVKPHVTPDNRISMNIIIEKKDLGLEYLAGRSFTTKTAETELLIDDGNTVVIGGIIKTTKSSGVSGVPWLSKIPLIGWLFKSTNKTDNKEELLIFITPRIVRLEQRDLIR
ncbi:MAG: type IV pilus secretin PilQ [Thermodesulfobacteriota bacterium]|nr:type IV pilus secretin PilQ [Thermodesulfobacteriota bacterium]